MFVV
jgi:hypothetical protein